MPDAEPQLNLDGGEDAGPPRVAPLNGTQQLILGIIREQGGIRSVQAGVLVHESRGTRCCMAGAGADRFKGTPRAMACCAYASSDGLEALKRLEARGLIKRGKKIGMWKAA